MSGTSAASARKAAVAGLPIARLTPEAQERIRRITNSPTFFRRLPPQEIVCDRDLFLFLTRQPEVLVGIWDLMGITKVQVQRTGRYQLDSGDGSGTQCRLDLVYGDPHQHIYVADGVYDGRLVARPIRGRGVFIVRSDYEQTVDGQTTVQGTIDCFIKIDSLGADLIARTFSPLIGRSADHNFVETARFVGQIHQACERNPAGMMDTATNMPQVGADIRRQFATEIYRVAGRSQARIASLSELGATSGLGRD
ncbi:MAG: hypothetical protein AAF664_14130 [Planctomycetota bacterium]